MSTKYSVSVYCEDFPTLQKIVKLIASVEGANVKAEAQADASEVVTTETAPAKKGPGRPKKDSTSTVSSGAQPEKKAASAPAPSPAASKASVDPLGEDEEEAEDAAVDPLGDDEEEEEVEAATFEEALELAKKVSNAKGGDALMAVLKQFGVERIGSLKKQPGAEDGSLYVKVIKALKAA